MEKLSTHSALVQPIHPSASLSMAVTNKPLATDSLTPLAVTGILTPLATDSVAPLASPVRLHL